MSRPLHSLKKGRYKRSKKHYNKYLYNHYLKQQNPVPETYVHKWKEDADHRRLRELEKKQLQISERLNKVLLLNDSLTRKTAADHLPPGTLRADGEGMIWRVSHVSEGTSPTSFIEAKKHDQQSQAVSERRQSRLERASGPGDDEGQKTRGLTIEHRAYMLPSGASGVGRDVGRESLRSDSSVVGRNVEAQAFGNDVGQQTEKKKTRWQKFKHKARRSIDRLASRRTTRK